MWIVILCLSIKLNILWILFQWYNSARQTLVIAHYSTHLFRHGHAQFIVGPHWPLLHIYSVSIRHASFCSTMSAWLFPTYNWMQICLEDSLKHTYFNWIVTGVRWMDVLPAIPGCTRSGDNVVNLDFTQVATTTLSWIMFVRNNL